MRFISLPAAVVAFAYACVVSALLLNATGDAEDITMTWLKLGFPGVFFVSAWHGWGAIALNSVILYALIAYAIPAIVKAYRKHARPPE